MEVEANITRLDILKMQVYLIPRIKAYLYLYIFILIFGTVAAWDSIGEVPIVALVLIVLVSSLIGFMVMISLAIGFQLLFASEKNGFLGMQKFRITDWGFEEVSAGTETKTAWKSVERIFKSKNYLYVLISAYRVHVVPRRSFASDEEFLEFAAFAQNYL